MTLDDLVHRTLIALRAAGPSRDDMIERLLRDFTASTTPSWLADRSGLQLIAQTVTALVDELLLLEVLTSSRPRQQIERAVRKLTTFVDYAALTKQFGLTEAKQSKLARRLAPKLPKFNGLPALARWLDLPLDHLDWYAGLPPYRPHGTIGSIHHYRYEFHTKRNGSPRLIEAPKPRLKAIQQKILHEILDHVPPHKAAHGFISGRGVITSATPHAGEAMLIAADLADFFTTINAGRIHGIFRALGYKDAIATRLAGLTTTATPAAVFRELPREQRPAFKARRLYRTAHLPQGAPTSPMLANLAAYHLDTRLLGLAQRFNLAYTRYADDLAFSGNALGAGGRAALYDALDAITHDEGFLLNPAKTRHMAASARQSLLGMTINSHLNLPRDEFDRLKAILHLAAKNGPDAENRDGHADFRAHLLGRIGWVAHVNLARGAKLQRLFNRIVWPRF